MLRWIIDWMPWWVWYVGGGVVALATFHIWFPVARGIWAILPSPVRWALGAAAAALAAYLAGRNRGVRNARDEQKAKDARAVQTRAETAEEIGKLPDPEKQRRFEKWLRD